MQALFILVDLLGEKRKIGCKILVCTIPSSSSSKVFLNDMIFLRKNFEFKKNCCITLAWPKFKFKVS